MYQLVKVAMIGALVGLPSVACARDGPFDSPALGQQTLAAVTGTGSAADFARNLHVNVDQDERSSFDTTAMIGRVTFDNWFAREGADLIAAGALGRPLVLR